MKLHVKQTILAILTIAVYFIALMITGMQNTKAIFAATTVALVITAAARDLTNLAAAFIAFAATFIAYAVVVDFTNTDVVAFTIAGSIAFVIAIITTANHKKLNVSKKAAFISSLVEFTTIYMVIFLSTKIIIVS